MLRLAGWVILTSCVAGAARAAELTLPELMKLMAEVSASAGRFTETRHIALLDTPLVLEGDYAYRSPDYLRKTFDDPDAEGYEVEGATLRILYADGRRQQVALDEHPVLRAYVEGLRATLAGDLASLERYFLPEVKGSAERWRLHLQPRLPGLAERLSTLLVGGRSHVVERIEARKVDGDYTVMVLHPRGE